MNEHAQHLLRGWRSEAPVTPALLQRSQRGRQSKRKGREFEERALSVLLGLGLASGEILATPKIVMNGKVHFTKKVMADIVGVWKDGRGVLCECKVRSDKGRFRRPRPSDFETHQRDRLMQWHRAGAFALVAYTLDGFTVIIDPAMNFFPIHPATTRSDA